MAIDHAAGSQIGGALNVYWRGMKLFTLCAGLLLVGLFTFVAVVNYAPIYRVPAYTDVAGGLIKLSAISDARISKLVVGEGAQVEKGDVLALLDTDRLTVTGRARGASLTKKLDGERAMITREMEAARDEAQSMGEIADRKVAGYQAERASLRAEVASNVRLLASLRRQSERLVTVAAKGYISQTQADQKSDEVALQESRLAASSAAVSRLDSEIETTRVERRLADSKLAGIIERRQRESSDLDRLSTDAMVDSAQVVVAPEAGMVSSSLVARGQSVLVGQTLFTLAPRDEALIVRLLVPARAAGVVRAGLKVKIVFQAYPQEKFGEFDSQIEQVSTAPLMPADLPQMFATQGPAYVAVASLSLPLRGPNGKPLVVKAGMLADALVPMERRSALAWMLEPILRGFNASADRDASNESTAP